VRILSAYAEDHGLSPWGSITSIYPVSVPSSAEGFSSTSDRLTRKHQPRVAGSGFVKVVYQTRWESQEECEDLERR